MNQIYIFCVILIISILLQGTFFIVVFKLFFYKKNQNNTVFTQKPVSIVIAARNEAHNLEKLLTSIFNQNYADFEVIVINDRSEDNSVQILEEFKRKIEANFENNFNQVNSKKTFQFITITEKPQNWNGKKYALQIGIKAAKNEIILLTDADCQPKDNFWIEKMADSFSEKINTVVGVSLYKKEKNDLLNWFIQNETLITALQYISFANFGMAYMGVGRNLAYKKSVFLGRSSVGTPTTARWTPTTARWTPTTARETPTMASIFLENNEDENNNTFEKIAFELGGDDDLIFSEKRFYKNVGICLDGQTQSKAPQNFREWFNQKRRHLAIGTKYSFRQKIISSIYPLSMLFWYISVLAFLSNGFYEVLGFELFRQLLFFVILRIFYNQLQNNYVSIRSVYKNFVREFFTTFFCFELLFIFYYLVMAMVTIFFPPKKWK